MPKLSYIMTKKILITGASGFIGGAITQKVLSLGYTVVKTTRDPAARGEDAIFWDPDHDGMRVEALEGLEGVIHLAGENIAALLWTHQKKKRIFLSRVRGTWLLARAFLRVKKAPRFFFSASAVGYYGNRGDQILTEETPQGSGFLAEVCSEWERASDILKEKGVRVLHGRFGNVLDPSGGMLKKILPSFKWGFGAQMGCGRQWMSWISRDDLVRAIEWIVFTNPMEGVINCTSPNPVTQREWAKTVAAALHRPQFLKLPGPLVRAIFGQMGEELFLYSTRATPSRLLRSGFKFLHPTLQEALLKKLSSEL